MKSLPKNVAIRIVTWGADGHIRDVMEHNNRTGYRDACRTALKDTDAVKRTLEVCSNDENYPSLAFNADLVSTTPLKCRTTQPSLMVDDTPLSLDRFWDMLCDSIGELVASKPSHMCSDECRCNNE